MGWGLVSFLKDAGEKLFALTQSDAEKAQALKAHLDKQGLSTAGLTVAVENGAAKIGGAADSAEVLEKAVLTVGNVAGIESVVSTIAAPQGAAEARTYTVVKGDNLSKISKQMYGTPNKYQDIFEANRPMLSHPDKIYPGQVLRIPSIPMAKAV